MNTPASPSSPHAGLHALMDDLKNMPFPDPPFPAPRLKAWKRIIRLQVSGQDLMDYEWLIQDGQLTITMGKIHQPDLILVGREADFVEDFTHLSLIGTPKLQMVRPDGQLGWPLDDAQKYGTLRSNIILYLKGKSARLMAEVKQLRYEAYPVPRICGKCGNNTRFGRVYKYYFYEQIWEPTYPSLRDGFLGKGSEVVFLCHHCVLENFFWRDNSGGFVWAIFNLVLVGFLTWGFVKEGLPWTALLAVVGFIFLFDLILYRFINRDKEKHERVQKNDEEFMEEVVAKGEDSSDAVIANRGDMMAASVKNPRIIIHDSASDHNGYEVEGNYTTNSKGIFLDARKYYFTRARYETVKGKWYFK